MKNLWVLGIWVVTFGFILVQLIRERLEKRKQEQEDKF